jgi:hypothetical protein
MYEYRPPHRNAIARLLALGLFLLAVATFVTAAFVQPPFVVICQSVGLVLMVPTIQILTRYVVARYLYRLCPYEDGNVDLEVYSYRGGARMQLVCRVGLEEITATAPLTDANRKAPAGIRRYNYAPDIRPADALVLSITNEDGDCEVLICPDEKLTAALTK